MVAYPHPESLVKSFYCGQMRQELLRYPAEPRQQEKQAVDEILQRFGDLAPHIDPRAIDRDNAIPEQIRQGMAELGLFGLTVPQEYGGLSLGTRAYARVIEAVTAACPALMLMLGAHLSIGLKGLVLYGTEQQKARYLPGLAKGEALAAFALTEPQAGSDASALHTTAHRDGNGWRLNGSKIWISNGDVAQLITVFASTPEIGGRRPITAFIIEPSFEGFSLGPHAMKLGLHGTNSTVLRFENVFVPDENVLGQPGEGFSQAVHILNSGRVGLGAACVGAMKNSLKLGSEWVTKRTAFGSTISEYELIQDKIAQIAIDVFAAESMVHWAAGWIDQGMSDYGVEAAAIKIFASEAAWHAADELVQMAGGRGYVGPYPYERILRDTRVNRIFEGTNEVLRLLVFDDGTKPLRQYMSQAGKSTAGAVSFAVHKLSHLSPPAVNGSLDPRLTGMADQLSRAAANLHRSTEATLQRLGAQLVQRQMIVARLADMAIDTFGMCAVLARVQSLLDRPESLAPALELAQSYFWQAELRAAGNQVALTNNDDRVRNSVAHRVYDRGSHPLA
jgi:acyl-CoA dehydrogenase family member 9